MATRKLVIGTKNKKKLLEMRRQLEELDVEVVSIEDVCPDLESPEETGLSFEENAILKANYFSQHSGLLCVADDSGLEVDALDGAPGIYSSRFAGEDGNDAANNEKLLTDLKGVAASDRGAQFRTVLAVALPGKVMFTVAGAVRGTILEKECGVAGFGYDPLFYYPPWQKTFAEVSLDKKATVSHRGVALRELAEKMPALLSIVDNRNTF